jgi:hypothetical protein
MNYIDSDPKHCNHCRTSNFTFPGNLCSKGNREPFSFWWESEKENDYQDLGRTRESNIKMDLREIREGGMDCTHRARDKDQWRALENTIMNIGVP